MKRRLDIDGINEILAGGDTREKIEALEELGYQLPEWDIFPVSMLLPGLADPDKEVRARTFSLLRYYPEKFSDQDDLQILRMIENANDEVRRLAIETISAVVGCVKISTLREVMHYLWHKDEGVRATAIEVFTELSYQFTEEMFLTVAEAYNLQSIKVRESIAEFLERCGHGGLISHNV